MDTSQFQDTVVLAQEIARLRAALAVLANQDNWWNDEGAQIWVTWQGQAHIPWEFAQHALDGTE